MELMVRRTVVRESDACQNPRIAGETCRVAFGVANQATGRRANIFLINETMLDFDLVRRRHTCERSQRLLTEPKLWHAAVVYAATWSDTKERLNIDD